MVTTTDTQTPNVVVMLVVLYLAADWNRIRSERGYAPGERWVDEHGVLTGITRENRRSSFRLYALGHCIGCHAEVNGNSTGDHIVALARGGPDHAGNYLPLCRSCNASKGTRDLLDWWASKPRDGSTLDPDVLISYARVEFAVRNRTRRTNERAPNALVAISTALAEPMSPAIKRRVWRRALAVAGRDR